jgi:hypothetical protein
MGRALLPGSEVGVVEGRWGERVGLVEEEGVVEGLELGEEDGLGPTVGDDVMDGQEEGVVVGRASKERGSEERAVREGEGGVALFVYASLELVLGVDMEDRKGPGGGRMDDLDGASIEAVEGGAERFVSLDEGFEGASERLVVERSANAEGEGDVVGRRIGGKLVEEPESLLREGERQGPVARDGEDGDVGGDEVARRESYFFDESPNGGGLEEGA